MQRTILNLIAAIIPATTAAQDITILVAPRDSPAYEAATSLEDESTVFAERRIHRAFDRAADHMAVCGQCMVTINLAGGAYTGRGDTGMWTFPEVVTPDAGLRILGGWAGDFNGRTPFETPTVLVSTPERSGPVMQFVGRRPAMAELVVSGLVFDTSPSNSYDAGSNALMKGGSSTWGQLSVGYLETTQLTIADNVFMNAPEGVAGPQLKTPDAGLRIDIQNNVFFNSVAPWVIPGGVSDAKPSEIAIRGNTFVLNWPRNPDPTTSNPGTLQIGNNYSTDHVLIEGNIFAWNVGGAIYSEWDHDRSPPITIRDNLFWQNGQLFGATADDDGAVVGKFNGAATHSIYDAIDLEDDFDWTTQDNVSFDPLFLLEIPDLKAVQYGSDFRGADVAAPEGQDAPTDGLDADTQAEVDDFAAQLAALTGEPASGSDGTEGIAGDGGVVVFGPDNDIANFAPRLLYDQVGIPMPTAGKAALYGASADRIWRAD